MANEKRLIDVNKVIDAMQKCIDECSKEEKRSIAYYAFSFIITALKQEPTVDAVEVVRCKDCIVSYCHGDDDFVCGRSGVNVDPDDFCSYGERKDNG